MFIRLQNKELECDALQNKLDQLTLRGNDQGGQNAKKEFNPYIPNRQEPVNNIITSSSTTATKNAACSPIVEKVDPVIQAEETRKPKTSQTSLVTIEMFKI